MLTLPDYDIDLHMHDVETLNVKAMAGTFDVTKLSMHAYLKLRDKYVMLNSGAALGYGCGPLVVARKDMTIDDILRGRVAIPGELTTAHLLFRLWAPAAANRAFLPYDQIMPSVVRDDACAGVIIHEGRFTYESLGLTKLADLGEWWQSRTDLPLPLGCIAAKQSLGEKLIRGFDALLKQSIEISQANPASTIAYVTKHAREMDSRVLLAHIDTYVNDFSLDLSSLGRRAVRRLEEEAVMAGVLQ